MYQSIHVIDHLILCHNCVKTDTGKHPSFLHEWILVWNDEFNGNTLDHDKWNVTDGQQDVFEYHLGEDEVVSYSINNTKNVRIINGLLALTPFQEELNDRNITAATINSRNAFLFGRLDIRAAFPEGSLLKTAFILIPRDNNYGNEGNINGRIEIIVDQQQQEFYSSVYYGVNTRKLSWYLPDTYNLNEFHNYSLEWNRTQLTWRLNDYVHFSFDLNQILSEEYHAIGQPFDKEFYLSIRLQIFTILTQNQFNPEINYHKLWPCPSLLVDHVRFFRESNYSDYSENNSLGINLDEVMANLSKKELCEQIKHENYPSFDLFDESSVFNLKNVWKFILPIISLLLLSGLVIVYLVIKIRHNVSQIPDENNYYDCNENEIDENNDYEDPDKYLNLYDAKKDENYEVITKNDYYDKGEYVGPRNQYLKIYKTEDPDKYLKLYDTKKDEDYEISVENDYYDKGE